MKDTVNQHLDDIVGRLILNQGLVTPEALMEALSEQAMDIVTGDETKPRRPLSEILLQKGLLTEPQLAAILQEAEARIAPTLGDEMPTTGEGGGARSRLGKYSLLRELGRGGMGCVFEAWDTELHRKVALKLMFSRPHLEAEERTPAEERFLREAQLTAQIPKHPNIVGIFEAGILEGRRYLAMEFIEGRPMSDWTVLPAITFRQRILLLADVALAVHHAHEHGVIHRDLKPQNVLVTSTDHAYVTDFGLAKAAEAMAHVSLTASGMTVGTPMYMSPEQAQGLKSTDRRTDIYSLGVMLYEILAGKPPFVGETAVEILLKTVKHQVMRPSVLTKEGRDPAVDETIENICLKAMARLPRERYPNAKAFAEDLLSWLEGEPVRVRAPRPFNLYEVKSSYRYIFGIVAAGVLGLVIPFAWPVMFPDMTAVALLGRADRALDEERYQDALVAYAQVLAVEPGNERAVTGQRKAQEKLDEQQDQERLTAAHAAEEKARRSAEEAMKAYRNRESELVLETKSLKAVAEEARRAAAAAAEAEAKAVSASKTERDRLATERAAAETRARVAEENARRAEKRLQSLTQEAAKTRKALEALQGITEVRLAGRTPLPAAAVDPATLRPGLAGAYYEGSDFDTLAFARVDPCIDFHWLSEPAWPGGPTDNFAVRWTGYLRVPRSSRYAFETVSEDGVRLFIDDVVVLSDWTPHNPAITSGACLLEDGFHRLRLEFFDGGASAAVTLAWRVGSESEAETIPPEQFFHSPADLRKPPAGTPSPPPPAPGKSAPAAPKAPPK